ncbi:hypothetical protein PQJ75_08480 [Rhodoplanes sp. TEM]|uniref:Uncharacterized protein n=1 Tax=Rhodoplanes tepidamans TaxID=200616 RepID=A0ABT5JBA0_RHOTP|nr:MULTISPECIES: hypothetical protein [Rhodoplanes]MDC7786757.1 hypothetical protein [Rhodoplanes tepidamans]MDC7983763.1 hypothetical protein [Rhodoplanes sp. TEM]MDQ0358194.1 hypothetical protein [Rhodoplanes tepidamans]
MIRFATMSAAAAIVCAALSSQPAVARTPYDGPWSVVIITDRGTCDRAYRYSVQIVDGIVRYAGEMGMDFRGRVGRGGAVSVSVAAGGSRADGRGRLGRDYGGGTWAGYGSTGRCSGRWTAERR